MSHLVITITTSPRINANSRKRTRISINSALMILRKRQTSRGPVQYHQDYLAHNPVNYLTSPLFGHPTQTLASSLGSGGVNGGFNPLYQIGGSRSIQLALKLQF